MKSWWDSTKLIGRNIVRPTLSEADGKPILQAVEENNSETIRSWFTGREQKVNNYLFQVHTIFTTLDSKDLNQYQGGTSMNESEK